MTDIKTRSALTPEDKWNVEALYPSLASWQEDLNLFVKNKTPPFWPELQLFKGRLKESEQTLKNALETLLLIEQKLDKLYTYAHLRHDEDITNNDHKAAFQKISSLLCDYRNESAWFEPELLSLPESLIEKYLKNDVLSEYRFYIEKIVRLRAHTLSADKEELLALVGKPLQTSAKAFSALNNADLKFNNIKDSKGEEKPLTQGLYQLYLRSKDRTLRKNAFEEVQTKYQSFQNTLGELISGQLETHFFQAKTRSFSSSLQAALFPHNIPEGVYKSLIQAVRKGLPLLHKYIALRKKLLKVDELHFYDMYVPLVSEVEFKMKREEAVDLVIESVAPLGQEYQTFLDRGLRQEKWVDWVENTNKRSGAYSSGCFDSYPYILMNYRETLRDVFTLAHEAGHSMQSFLSNRTQPYHYSRYPIFVAEVASTFNEELLADCLLKKMDKKEQKIFLLQEKIEDLRATFFRQTMFAEYELELHSLVEQGVPLTPQLLKEVYYKLNCDYFGKEAVIDELIAIEWARIPHFYYNFYVYQYATGISAALALSEKVLSGDLKAREGYLTFLKSGSKDYPINLLKKAGVDMTSSLPVEATLRKFDYLVSTLETELSLAL